MCVSVWLVANEPWQVYQRAIFLLGEISGFALKLAKASERAKRGDRAGLAKGRQLKRRIRERERERALKERQNNGAKTGIGRSVEREGEGGRKGCLSGREWAQFQAKSQVQYVSPLSLSPL